MVDVIKDSRQWRIQVDLPNEDCPYLYYPANYHGCKLVPDVLHDDEKGYCTLENCKLRIASKL